MSDSVSLNASKERGARTFSGYLMFAVAMRSSGCFYLVDLQRHRNAGWYG
jgi:hypothetical protein